MAATKNLRLAGVTPGALYLGSTKLRRCYLGTEMVWNDPVFVDEPKIDPAHSLANRTTMRMLTAGDPTGTTLVTGATAVVDDAMASTVAGTVAMRRQSLPAPNSTSWRASAVIKVDKTAGRYSRFSIANAAAATTATPDVYVGHNAGTGIVLAGHSAGVPTTLVLLAEAQLVDQHWYRVSITYDNVTDYDATDTNTGKARVTGSVEPVDPADTPADPWYPLGSSRHDSVGAGANVPTSMTARTNSALGTVKDCYYIDTLYGATSNGTDPVDDAPFNTEFKQTSGTDRTYVYGKGKAAPLRIIIAAGGTGIYGGTTDFGLGTGRAGHPHNAARKFWRDLANLGYTVVHANALHEGWGADDHLAKQLDALNKIQALTGVSDARIYYIGYSMGGASLWRALRGRAGFPPIRAAYSLAGISRLTHYWDINGIYAQVRTRWPVRADIDEPQSYSTAELVARGTRVRMVTSTADTNVLKVDEHDPMFAKYAGTGLATERVLAVDHFHPSYWDAQDCVDFFEGADA